ncbi:MAG: hypothetical protein R3F59_04025 [Myxococcota bacterium]
MFGRWMGAAALIVAGCAGGPEAAPEGAAPAAPEAAPEEAVTAPQRTEPLTEDDDTPARYGKVLESMDSGGYTFARLDACGMEAWVAGPVTPLEVGQSVSMPMGTVMTQFKAPSLGRDFDMILFVPWFRTVEASEVPACAPLPDQAGAKPGARPQRAGPPGDDEWPGTVLETMNSGGYTYLHLAGCNDEQLWVAAPLSKIAKGQPVAAAGGVPMTNFHSGTLDRTFDTILFAQEVRVLSQPVSCK